MKRLKSEEMEQQQHKGWGGVSSTLIYTVDFTRPTFFVSMKALSSLLNQNIAIEHKLRVNIDSKFN